MLVPLTLYVVQGVTEPVDGAMRQTLEIDGEEPRQINQVQNPVEVSFSFQFSVSNTAVLSLDMMCPKVS